MRAVLGLLGVLLATSDARADCAIPQWVGTADGTPVPTTGVLDVHDESLRWSDKDPPMVEVLWTGTGAGTATFTRVDDAVARLDYAGPAGSQLMLRFTRGDEQVSFRLVERWRMPDAAPRVLRYWHQVYAWTCSSSDSMMLQLDQHTAAVRARWTYNGRTVDYIEAARTDGSKAVVELGSINCGGESIPVDQLRDGGRLELFAIRHDGSEVKIEGLPARITTRDIGVEDRGLDAASVLVTLDAPPPVVMRAATKPGHTRAIVALAMLLLGAMLGIRLAGRSASGCSPASE